MKAHFLGKKFELEKLLQIISDLKFDSRLLQDHLLYFIEIDENGKITVESEESTKNIYPQRDKKSKSRSIRKTISKKSFTEAKV